MGGARLMAQALGHPQGLASVSGGITATEEVRGARSCSYRLGFGSGCLRAGRKSVTDAVAAGRSTLAGQEIEQIRAAYREQAQAGITANLGRRTSKGGKHPAWVLAQRFHDKIDLILHHLTDFTVPWTSNLAEQALRHAKIHLKISGCFRSLETTRAYCRIHSYLITIRLNAVPPMKAIRDALAGHPWTPLQALMTA
jgi:transposase